MVQLSTINVDLKPHNRHQRAQRISTEDFLGAQTTRYFNVIFAVQISLNSYLHIQT